MFHNNKNHVNNYIKIGSLLEIFYSFCYFFGCLDFFYLGFFLDFNVFSSGYSFLFCHPFCRLDPVLGLVNPFLRFFNPFIYFSFFSILMYLSYLCFKLYFRIYRGCASQKQINFAIVFSLLRGNYISGVCFLIGINDKFHK